MLTQLAAQTAPMHKHAAQAKRRTLRTLCECAARVSGPAPKSDRGVPLDSQLHGLLTLHRRLGIPGLQEMEVSSARRTAEEAFTHLGPDRSGRVEVLDIPGPEGQLRCELYRPAAPPRGPIPMLVYFHGGGFVVGDPASYRGVCQALAEDGGLIVVSVDYRRAPKRRFPAAVDDALASFRYLRSRAAEFGADPSRVAIGGDSAGGNLSAVTCLALRASGEPQPSLQVLIYPSTDMRRVAASHRLFREGYLLDKPLIDWFLEQYLPSPAQAHEWRASPLLADGLSDLAPAHIITAGFDPLRDEGDQYAHALSRAGVPVRAHTEHALIHGFVTMTACSSQSELALRRIGVHAGDTLRSGRV